MRPRGLILDHPEVVKRRCGFGRMRRRLSAVAAPASVDLSSFVLGSGGPGIPNQGQYGDCVGWSTRGFINTRLAIMGTPVAPLSAYCIYRVARMIDRGGPTGALTDSGTTPGSADSAVSNWGTVSDATWGADNDTTLNVDADLSQLEEASDFTVNGVYYLTDTSTLVADMQTALAGGFPIRYSLPASGNAFQSYTGGVMTSLDGPIDHENYIVGYDGSSFLCVNSWGTSWGASGFYRIAYSVLSQCADFAVGDVVAKGTER